MMYQLHYLASLPRSGSTLLCNILAQNPRFWATHSSGLCDTLVDMRNTWDRLAFHKTHPLPEAKKACLRAVALTYHTHWSRPVIFDKARGWPAWVEMMEGILGERIKILFCYRGIADILVSMESLRRRTIASGLKPPDEPDDTAQLWNLTTVEQRCQCWLHPANVLGLARDRVLDCLRRGFRDRLHFIHYDDLCREPEKTMRGVYEFLEEPHCTHEFDHVEQVTEEDDAIHGYVGLHDIRPRVEHRPSRAVEILGADLVTKCRHLNLEIW